MPKKRILVAPLNWGLGHATRCIPIIHALEESGYEPILASDGAALKLLQKEFPQYKSYEMPSYNITYTKKGAFLIWRMLLKSFQLFRSLSAERKITEHIVAEENICGIISDNRMGVLAKKVPSVYITHQLNVLSGSTTFFSSRVHQFYIKKFDACWVPDVEEEPSLSGKLGHLKKNINTPTTYIGPLSRFKKEELNLIYDFMVILSGPEPQRTFLEDKLLKELESYNGKILFVRGIIENEQKKEVCGNFTQYNYLLGKELETAINQSDVIVARSGYTTLMDLAKLHKKAFFIPTPGQTEQIYLAKRLQKKQLAPYCKQHQFSLKKLSEVERYHGLSSFTGKITLSSLFRFFERE